MISNEKLKLLGVWSKNLFDEFSISEVMKLSRKKTKTWVFNALKMLVEQDLLVMKRKGNINLYSLNYDNPFLVDILHYLDIQNNLKFSQIGIISDAISKIPVKNYCLLVFGSYASKEQKASSDLDICFLIDNKNTEKKIKPYFNEVKMDYPVEMDEHYITFNDFMKMLLSEEENLGKQIFRNHLLFFNADVYYELIKEAHKNGFRL